MSKCLSKIQIKRGLEADFASVTLMPGELALVTDTGKLYIGDADGNKVLINPTYGTAAELNIGVSNGDIPVLGEGGKLDTSVLPSLAVTEVTVVNSEAEMLTLVAQPGDVAVRTDVNETYMLAQEPATDISNWIKISHEIVTSVNGKIGDVVLVGEDILLPTYAPVAVCGKIKPSDSVTSALAKLEYRIDNIDGGSFV